jgi:hypothetical protein
MRFRRRTLPVEAARDRRMTPGLPRTAWCDLPLATLNFKDFEDFAEYEGLTVIGTNDR